jgi:hypothetical protein
VWFWFNVFSLAGGRPALPAGRPICVRATYWRAGRRPATTAAPTPRRPRPRRRRPRPARLVAALGVLRVLLGGDRHQLLGERVGALVVNRAFVLRFHPQVPDVVRVQRALGLGDPVTPLRRLDRRDGLPGRTRVEGGRRVHRARQRLARRHTTQLDDDDRELLRLPLTDHLSRLDPQVHRDEALAVRSGEDHVDHAAPLLSGVETVGLGPPHAHAGQVRQHHVQAGRGRADDALLLLVPVLTEPGQAQARLPRQHLRLAVAPALAAARRPHLVVLIERVARG